jgi:hypothetical protein
MTLHRSRKSKAAARYVRFLAQPASKIRTHSRCSRTRGNSRDRVFGVTGTTPSAYHRLACFRKLPASAAGRRRQMTCHTNTNDPIVTATTHKNNASPHTFRRFSSRCKRSTICALAILTRFISRLPEDAYPTLLSRPPRLAERNFWIVFFAAKEQGRQQHNNIIIKINFHGQFEVWKP